MLRKELPSRESFTGAGLGCTDAAVLVSSSWEGFSEAEFACAAFSSVRGLYCWGVAGVVGRGVVAWATCDAAFAG